VTAIGKIFAQSESRYNGGARVKRQYGSSTVTKFLVGVQGSPASSWVEIDGYGKTPGDRKTFAMSEYARRYGDAKTRELSEMQDILKRFGYEPKHAERLQVEGMGPFELEDRARQTGLGDLKHTHGIRKVSDPAPYVPLFPGQVSLFPPGTRGAL